MNSETKKGWRIWPANLFWGDLDRSVRRHVVIAVGLYLLVATVGLLKPGPTPKDMMMIEFARTHVDEGLQQTHGYNLGTKWNTSPTKVLFGAHHVYVSAPPLYPLYCGAWYALGGNQWRAVRLAPITLGLIFLYSCLALAGKYLRGPARGWLLYFALSPMILIYATDLEINTGHLGLAVLAYLCFTSFLETAQRRWMVWASVFYLLAFWNSFVAFSIVPAMLVQLLWHRGLTPAERRQGLWIWLGAVGVGFAVVVLHLAVVPGALEWALGRARERSSSSLGTSAKTEISAVAFVIRQGLRLVTHYTPICLALAGGALLLTFWRRTPGGQATERQAVSDRAVLLQFFTWGLPSGLLALNLAYIHPHFLYYAAIFFAFGSALGLGWLANRIGRGFVINACLGLFLLLSLSRSVFAIRGGSLPGLLRDYLPAFVTQHWHLDDKSFGNIVTVPPEQW